MKKINIGIDGNEANLDTRVGVNTYAYNLINSIYSLNRKDVSITVLLKESPKKHMPKERDGFKYVVIKGGGQWIIKSLSPYLWKNKSSFDVFWSPSHYIPFTPFTPTACSIMDLGYLEFKSQFKAYDFWQLTLWTSYSILFSKAILSISESTKKDIAKYYPFARKNITTTLLGFDNSRKNLTQNDVDRVKKKYGISGDYYLFMSTLKPSKNIEGLLEAWKIFAAGLKLKLVIAGKKGWLFDKIFLKYQSLGLEGSVIFTDFVDEDDKQPLIFGSKAFLLPSFWEGFGLDVLTAQNLSVPVLVSKVGSLPEVAGEGAFYCDPYSVDSIVDGIRKIYELSPSEKKVILKKGNDNILRFSWNSAAKSTIDKLVEISRK
jgi:glycosyltransferase involved in cell wall biosynthesis